LVAREEIIWHKERKEILKMRIRRLREKGKRRDREREREREGDEW
jgi:hypothetical protein